MLNPASIAGEGLAMQPEFLVWRQLREGSLESGYARMVGTAAGAASGDAAQPAPAARY